MLVWLILLGSLSPGAPTPFSFSVGPRGSDMRVPFGGRLANVSEGGPVYNQVSCL